MDVERHVDEHSNDSNAPPEWETLEEDVLCPLCAYHLRGLTVPRCPECGYRFTWPEVLDPNRRLHPYLYEHHPERGLRALVVTALNTVLALKFFSTLHPVQPIHRNRLIRYVMITSGVYVMAILLLLGLRMGTIRYAQMQTFQREAKDMRAYFSGVQPSSLQGVLMAEGVKSVEELIDKRKPSWSDTYAVLEFNMSASAQGFYALAYLPCIPWICFASLLIFQQTMRRAKIHSLHVFRAVAYSFDMVFWIGLILMPIVVLMTIEQGLDEKSLQTLSLWVAGLFPFVAILGLLRLVTAYQLYLRFPDAGGTIFLVAIIVFLVVLNGILYIHFW